MFKKLGTYAGSIMMALAFGWALPAQGQNAVKMIQGDSKETIFMLSDTPTVTFEEDTIVVECRKEKVSCELEGCVKFEFITYNNASVDSVVKESPVFKVNQNNIEAFNLSPLEMVRITDLSGKTVFSSKTDINGHIYIETGNYPSGVYIFFSKDKNFKFYKK